MPLIMCVGRTCDGHAASSRAGNWPARDRAGDSVGDGEVSLPLWRPSGKLTTPASFRTSPISPPLLAATFTSGPNPEAIRWRVNCWPIARRTDTQAAASAAVSVQMPCNSRTVSAAVVRDPRVGSNAALRCSRSRSSLMDGGPATVGSWPAGHAPTCVPHPAATTCRPAPGSAASAKGPAAASRPAHPPRSRSPRQGRPEPSSPKPASSDRPRPPPHQGHRPARRRPYPTPTTH